MNRKFIFILMLSVCIAFTAVMAFAAVEVKNAGTVVNKTETLNITGPAIAVDGTDVTINTLTETGAKVVTGTLNVTDAVTIDTDIYSTGVFVDGSIYATTTDGGATGGAGLYLSQPDGGCSKCYVDAAGTTFACANITCPAGM